MDRPKVGVGVIIQNSANEILIGKRIGTHTPLFSIPGGHLELGETFEAAAIREVFEETGLVIYHPKVICVTNNLRTFQHEGTHSISVSLLVNNFSGHLEAKEKDKCEWWKWFPLEELPQPQFDASQFAIECFRKALFYIPDQQ